MNQNFNFYNRMNNTRLNTLINNTLHYEPRYRRVISDDVFQKLKIVKYSKDTSKNDKCPILYIDFSEDDDVIILDCGHCFEPESIKKWLKEHKAECPVCRYKLDSVEIRVNDSTIQASTNTPTNTSTTASNTSNLNNNFRRLHDIDISQLITSLYRSNHLLDSDVSNSNIYYYTEQSTSPESSLATTGAGSDSLYIPTVQMMRMIHYDDDFYDFVEFYQHLFDLHN
jgi:hypothetical protein